MAGKFNDVLAGVGSGRAKDGGNGLVQAARGARNPSVMKGVGGGGGERTAAVEELIGADTVNTVPMKTIGDFRDHGVAKLTLQSGFEQAHKVFADLKEVGIDMKVVTEKLTIDGVESFAESFNGLIEVIKSRTEELRRAA